jgi:hypothetical protein
MDTTTLQKYEAMLKDLKATLQSEIEQSRAAAASVILDGTMGRISRGDVMQATDGP